MYIVRKSGASGAQGHKFCYGQKLRCTTLQKMVVHEWCKSGAKVVQAANLP